MKAWVFDIDGVLCDTGQTMSFDFRTWFINWAKDKKVFYVTGSHKEKTIEILGNEVYNLGLVKYHCLGNYIVTSKEEYFFNQFSLKENEHRFLQSLVKDSLYPVKTGNHINQRPGSINFSIVGRNADPFQRQAYKEFDKINNERISLIKEIQIHMPAYEAYLGGDISIDITKSGANKGQCVEYIRTIDGISDIIFFADRIGRYGIDQPFCDVMAPSDTFYHVNGYQDTWNILKKI